jgi:hypothetical protein
MIFRRPLNRKYFLLCFTTIVIHLRIAGRVGSTRHGQAVVFLNKKLYTFQERIRGFYNKVLAYSTIELR